ncbi:MAG: response regulator [Pseudomonadota bacterium]
MATILVVDDELGIRALLSEILTDEGHTVELAENAAQARSARERVRLDLVLLDIWMPDVDGITLLKEWSSGGQLTMPVIMMSGHGTIDTAVEATKYGAMAFLEKPITLQKLLRAVEQGLAKPAAPGAPKPAAAANGHGNATAAPSFRPDGHAHHPASPALSMDSTLGTPVISPATLGVGLQSLQAFELDRPLREARDAFEKSYFEFHLAKENGSMTRVAEKTGLERTHLYRKLKQLGVDLSRNKRNGGL